MKITYQLYIKKQSYQNKYIYIYMYNNNNYLSIKLRNTTNILLFILKDIAFLFTHVNTLYSRLL
jgi:hypothetical protein